MIPLTSHTTPFLSIRQVQIRASLDKDDSVTMLEVILRTDEGDVVVRDVAALGEGKSNTEEGKKRIVDTEEVM